MSTRTVRMRLISDQNSSVLTGGLARKWVTSRAVRAACMPVEYHEHSHHRRVASVSHEEGHGKKVV